MGQSHCSAYERSAVEEMEELEKPGIMSLFSDIRFDRVDATACGDPIKMPVSGDSSNGVSMDETRNHEDEPSSLDKLLAMPAKDRGRYLEAAAEAAAQAYENDPSLTEFTSLDGEDFEDYAE